MKKIKNIAILILSAFLSVLLSDCAPPELSSPLDYQKQAAYAELVGELNGVEFAATLRIDELPSDALKNGSNRDAVLTFSKPKALDGVEIKREGGASLLTADGIELPADLFSQLFLPIDAFSLLTDIVECKKTKDNDQIVYTEIILSDGSVILTDPTNGYPIRIKHEALDMNVINFNPKSIDMTKERSK